MQKEGNACLVAINQQMQAKEEQAELPDDTVGINVRAHAAVLAWQGLTVTYKAGNKVLLNGVSGLVAGGLTAVMGPSGCGKSTLLNALALRLDPRTAVTGEQRLNAKPYSSGLLKQIGGYVMQDDLLNGQLTVEETLQYTAKLRCPPGFTDEQRQARVEQALSDMGLLHVRGVIVGTPLEKGISGGERKRLCVALELITEPALLFLDEPTSGLDSVTALGLISTLKALAAGSATRHACTIITTIHQPQSKIFHMFDQLFLLQSGCVVYSGAAAGAQEHFSAMGYPCPAYTNPADHFMDLITVKNPITSEPSCPPVSHTDLLPDPAELRAYYKHVQVDMSLGAATPLRAVRQLVPWHRQFKVLLARALKEQIRKRSVVLTQLVQAVVIAVLIGSVFLHIGTTQASVVRRQPVLFFCVINQGVFAALVVINSFPSERMLVLRERAAGTYYASAYFMAKTTSDTLVQLPIPVIFSAIVYFMIGLQPSASHFFVFAGFMVLCNLAATSLALMVSTWCRTVDLSVTALPFLLEVCRLYGGFFLSPAHTPVYWRWLDSLSYVKWTYVGISLNELTGLVLSCSPAELEKAGGKCPVTSGEQTISQLGLGQYSIGLCAGILVLYILVCRFAAYLGLRLRKW